MNGLYQVSNLGRVRSLDRIVKDTTKDRYQKLKGKEMKFTDNGNGYKLVFLTINGKKENKYVHRLVCEAFIPNPENLMEVNHKDLNKSNNCVQNLEWVSSSRKQDTFFKYSSRGNKKEESWTNKIFKCAEKQRKNYNRKIYINGSLATSEDVIHEYTHLILGALKASNFEVYEKLLQKLPKDKHATNVRQSIKKNYPTLAKTDEDEEVFAVLFSEFLAGKSTDKIFEEVKEKVDDELKSIFTLASAEDFNKLYRGKVEAIFQIFSKDIGKAGNGLDFSKGTVYRQAANWISKQLENKNITEIC